MMYRGFTTDPFVFVKQRNLMPAGSQSTGRRESCESSTDNTDLQSPIRPFNHSFYFFFVR